jgi:hypothetical protein
MAVKQSGGVIVWTVPLKSRSHKISFEHGTTTGRRVIWVDDVEIRRQVCQRCKSEFENTRTHTHTPAPKSTPPAQTLPASFPF